MDESPAQLFRDLADTYRDNDERRAERVVWLLGAGFSKPLGGPLFSELLSENTGRWVRAWLSSRGLDIPDLEDAVFKFDYGRSSRLWANAEECLSLVDEARTNDVARVVVGNGTALPTGEIEKLGFVLRRFVAAATSHFVDQAERSSELPEAWEPFRSWAKSLSEADSIISFNYDRVVELLLKRAEKNLTPLKLHGTVPSDLCAEIRDGNDISTIATPGPGKMRHMRGPDHEGTWRKAEKVLQQAERLIVIGYSFPVSDPVVRSFVLSKCEATKVDIVVGPDECGDTIAGMFARFIDPKDVRNTRLTAQQFLAEGTARLSVERFNHWLPHPSYEG